MVDSPDSLDASGAPVTNRRTTSYHPHGAIHEITGTPAYLAPELALGDDADGRADLYALGCTAYWLLTGEHVFKRDSVMKVVVAHVMSEPPRPSSIMLEPLQPELEELVMSCLAKDRSERPSSAAEFARQLGLIVFPERWSQRRADAWWKARTPTALVAE